MESRETLTIREASPAEVEHFFTDGSDARTPGRELDRDEIDGCGGIFERQAAAPPSVQRPASSVQGETTIELTDENFLDKAELPWSTQSGPCFTPCGGESAANICIYCGEESSDHEPISNRCLPQNLLNPGRRTLDAGRFVDQGNATGPESRSSSGPELVAVHGQLRDRILIEAAIEHGKVFSFSLSPADVLAIRRLDERDRAFTELLIAANLLLAEDGVARCGHLPSLGRLRRAVDAVLAIDAECDTQLVRKGDSADEEKLTDCMNRGGAASQLEAQRARDAGEQALPFLSLMCPRCYDLRPAAEWSDRGPVSRMSVISTDCRIVDGRVYQHDCRKAA